MISHLKWMGHSATIFEIQKTLREDLQSCEVVLVAKDYSVRAHRFVLSSCSDFLRNIMAHLPLGEEATIILPDIKGMLLDSVLAFIYVGETQISSSNLSDFLEAINILGIKSAISFECNTTTNQNQNSNALPLKAIAGLQIVQGDIIEHENVPITKVDTQSVIAPQEFLEVYSESHPKIHYAIEEVAATNHGSEFILTENAGEFTLTQHQKVDSSANPESSKLVAGIDVEEGEGEPDPDADADDGSLIEEYSNSAAENIIEMTNENPTNTTESSQTRVPSNATPTPISTQIIEIKPNLRAIKLKTAAQLQQHLQLHQEDQHEKEQQQQQTTTIYNSNELDDTKETEFTIYQEPLAIDAPTTSSRLLKTESNSDPLELAVQAVLNEGMSLQKAAQKHDISKTVLWRRVRKDPNYNKTTRENPVISLACERLKHGESMKNISRELDIPMSTLHRHKVRLSLQGRLPKWVTFKKRDANSKDELREKLNKAVHACVHDGMSQNHAANLYDIPKSTLWRHLQKRVAEAEAMDARDIKEEVILS